MTVERSKRRFLIAIVFITKCYNRVHPSKVKTFCPLPVNNVFTIVLPQSLLQVTENSRDG